MDDYEKLLKIIERDFSDFDFPSDMLSNHADKSFSATLVRKEFEGLTRESMTIIEAKSLLMKGPVISDEAVIYFLPALLRVILKSGNDYDLLLWRLESLSVNFLNEKQIKTMNILTRALHDLELLADMEETLYSLTKIREDQIN